VIYDSETERLRAWDGGILEGWNDGYILRLRILAWVTFDGEPGAWGLLRLKDWNDGRMEGWNDGRMEGWNDGYILRLRVLAWVTFDGEPGAWGFLRLKDWNDGRMEGWKDGIMEAWSFDFRMTMMEISLRHCVSAWDTYDGGPQSEIKEFVYLF